jgi:hypothetical protein
MRSLNFLFSLLSLFPIKPEVGVKNHIVMSEIKQNVDKNQLNYFIRDNKIDKVINFSLRNNIYLSELIDNEDIEDIKSSKSNFLKYENSKYTNYLSFDKFCKLEKKISNIIDNYLLDNNRHYLIIVDDIFLSYDGIFKYLKFSDNSLFILNEKNSYVNYLIVNMKKESI